MSCFHTSTNSELRRTKKTFKVFIRRLIRKERNAGTKICVNEKIKNHIILRWCLNISRSSYQCYRALASTHIFYICSTYCWLATAFSRSSNVGKHGSVYFAQPPKFFSPDHLNVYFGTYCRFKTEDPPVRMQAAHSIQPIFSL